VPGTILIADDSPTIQRQASGILTGEGLEVVTVANGVAAIKKLATVKPLLVLADVSMPGRDGYEVCQFIKQSPEMKHVPVLLVFSDLEPYDQSRGAQAGVDGSVRKPFVHDELLGLVRRLIEQAQAAAPPPAAAAAPPPPPAPVFEPAESEPAPEPVPEPQISSVPGGIAFASDLPMVETEPGPRGMESVEAEPLAEPEQAGLAEQLAPEIYEPAVELSEEAAGHVEHGEPELVEELRGPVEELHEHPHPHERAPIFQAPEEIAEPILADEVEPATAEPVAAETEPEAVTSPFEPAPAGSENLRTEAASIEPHIIPPEEPRLPEQEVAEEMLPPSPEAFQSLSQPEPSNLTEPEQEAVPPGESEMLNPEFAAEHSAQAEPSAAAPLSREQVYKIVREVVVRMSPPALPNATIEELADRLTDEVFSSANL
jgi:CheY-like chemotaxis protein